MFHTCCLVFAIVSAGAVQPTRLAEDAPQIRAFRLNDTHLHKLRQVAETLARGYSPRPERPRSDAAVFTVLAMSPAFNVPFRDATIAETAQLIDSAHLDLSSAIRAAGWSAREYVLTHITLLLTVPAVARERAGQAGLPAGEVAAENAAFVRRHWSEIESIWTELRAAAQD